MYVTKRFCVEYFVIAEYLIESISCRSDPPAASATELTIIDPFGITSLKLSTTEDVAIKVLALLAKDPLVTKYETCTKDPSVNFLPITPSPKYIS